MRLNLAQEPILRWIGNEAAQQGITAYVVGGLVRDQLLDIQCTTLHHNVFDLDVVMEGDALNFGRHLQQRYGGELITHTEFRTATWKIEDRGVRDEVRGLFPHPSSLTPLSIDLITARSESYPHPAALPVVRPSNIEADLRRRDFTLNTLAVCLHPGHWGELLDRCGGVADLQAGLVRVLHEQSFVDDPTRIFRAVRYAVRFGFVIEPHTLEWLHQAHTSIAHLTGARVRHEFERIFHEAQVTAALEYLQTLDILSQVHPQLHVDAWTHTCFGHLQEALQRAQAPLLQREPRSRLAWTLLTYRFPSYLIDALKNRLAWDADTAQLCHELHQLNARLPALRATTRTSQLTAIFDEVSPTAVALWQLIYLEDEQLTTQAQRYLANWRHLRPTLNGRDLTTMGIPPGPIYRQILAGLRVARLDGIVQTRQEEIDWVQKFLNIATM